MRTTSIRQNFNRRVFSIGVGLTLLAACRPPVPAYLGERKAEGLLVTLQLRLDESVEAEEAAVIATTDGESRSFAAASRKAASEVEQLRGQVRETLTALGNDATLTQLDHFDETWKKMVALDAQILPLAVANTNLKAAQLSKDQGAAALDRMLKSLRRLATSTSDIDQVRRIGVASEAALKIQTLHAPHIAAADDASMTKLEGEIRELDAQVNSVLQTPAFARAKKDQTDVDAAKAAWAEYQKITAQVVQLSRQNTNVLSFQLSTHDKREATLACEGSLATLRSELQAIQNKRATR